MHIDRVRVNSAQGGRFTIDFYVRPDNDFELKDANERGLRGCINHPFSDIKIARAVIAHFKGEKLPQGVTLTTNRSGVVRFRLTRNQPKGKRRT